MDAAVVWAVPCGVTSGVARTHSTVPERMSWKRVRKSNKEIIKV